MPDCILPGPKEGQFACVAATLSATYDSIEPTALSDAPGFESATLHENTPQRRGHATALIRWSLWPNWARGDRQAGRGAALAA